MKKRVPQVKAILVCSMLVAGCFSSAFSQAVIDGLPKLMRSSLIEDIQVKAKTSKIGIAEVTDFANNNLALKGFEFRVDPCDAKTTETKIKFPEEYDGTFFHVYDMLDAAGKKISFLAREPGDAPCGCWLYLPITSVNAKGMTIVSDKGPIEAQIPETFLKEEVELVDASLRKTTATWIVPDGGPPDAISADGRTLYLEIEDTPLYLEISSTGALRFVPRTTPGIIKRFTDLKKFPKDPDNAYLGYRRFSSGKQSFVYKFSHTCT